VRRALDRDAALLVYPGGDHENYRPSWQSGKIGFGARTGFIALAVEHDVPVVPVLALGGQEAVLFFGCGRRPARGLQLDRLLRLEVLPLAIGLPFGLTMLDLPRAHPAAHRLVTGASQDSLSTLSRKRPFPVIG
jgi:hypothetical protein